MRSTQARASSLLSVAVLVPALAAVTAPAALAAPPHQPASASASAQRSAPATPSARTAVRLPVTFARNEGQAAPGVRYLGAGAGMAAAFTDTGVTVDLTHRRGDRGTGSGPATTSLTLRFVGANPHPTVTGADRAPGVVNDLRGSDPARWHTGIATYGRVVYHDLWPGIDGAFSAAKGTLKYSFDLAPGADPDDIRLDYTGADRLAVGRGGDLAVTTGGVVLRDEAPVSYQDTGGVRQPVATRYRLDGGTTFGFTLAPHAAGRLTVDPGLDYGTYLGGTDGNGTSGFSVGSDTAGNLYVFAWTDSATFPSTAGSHQTSLNPGGADITVTKLDPTGSRLVYSTFVGGSGFEGSTYGVVSPDGSVSVAAESFSRDFPTTADAYRSTPYAAAKQQSVAFRLDPTGSRLLHSTFLAPDLVPASIGLGSDGSVTVGGGTSSDYAPTTPGAFQTTYPGGWTAGYVMRLDAGLSHLAFATYLGAPITDQADTSGFTSLSSVEGVAVDSAGAVHAAVDEVTTGFPVTPGGFDATGDGLNIVVATLAPSDGSLDHATYVGNPAKGQIMKVNAIAVDRAGNSYVAGEVPPGSMTPTADAYQAQCVDLGCGGIAEFDPAGNLVYRTYFGGMSDVPDTHAQVSISDLSVDSAGRIYVVGESAAPETHHVPVTLDAYSTTPGDFAVPFFLSVLDRGTLLYSTYLGGTGSVLGIGGSSVGGMTMAPDVDSGAVYVGGTTAAVDFPVTPGAFQTTYPGGFNTTFAARFTLPAFPAPGTGAAASRRTGGPLMR